MDETLHHRLNQIPDKILSQEFLDAKGLGNEIGFWIFDYDPQAELEVREYISFLQDMLATKHSHLNVVHINLLSSLVAYLEERGFVDKAVELQKRKGDEGLLKALSGPLHMDKFAPYLVETCAAEERDMILISGVGSVWPLLRAHNLLNSLHSLLGHKPVVLFYPGEYTGQSMSLFGKIPSSNYYRAFKLVP
jgi:bacteriophage exclusion system BrxB-like protein